MLSVACGTKLGISGAGTSMSTLPYGRCSAILNSFKPASTTTPSHPDPEAEAERLGANFPARTSPEPADILVCLFLGTPLSRRSPMPATTLSRNAPVVPLRQEQDLKESTTYTRM